MDKPGAENQDQLLLVDKPYTWTSFDVVKKLRYALKVKKIGHAGTLDPLATGLLLIGVGRYTKQLQFLQGQDKEYDGIIEIGKTTPSYDLETEFDHIAPSIDHILESELFDAAKQLTGEIDQLPPVFSAVKIDGERAYKKARRKEEVALKVRKVQVREFEITKVDGVEVHFRIVCSKGTYIRSIAHDFGKLLGVGAYLKKLRRTAIGSYHLKDAWNLEELVKKASDHENH